MGSFDRVIVKCDCGEDLEFQSKAGNCDLSTYSLNNIPIVIAIDLNGSSEMCHECGKLTILTYHGPFNVRMIKCGAHGR
jgi:hypothetical protein